MRSLFLFLTCLLISACATPAVKPDAAYREAAAPKGDAVEQLYSPLCEKGSRLQPDHCGLLWQDFAAHEESPFVQGPCGGRDDTGCETKMRKIVEARWQLRYLKANAAHVNEWCARNAVECANPSLHELQWMDAHNEAVLKEFHLTKMDAKLHAKRYYARIRREQREAGLLKEPVPEAEGETSVALAGPAPKTNSK